MNVECVICMNNNIIGTQIVDFIFLIVFGLECWTCNFYENLKYSLFHSNHIVFLININNIFGVNIDVIVLMNIKNIPWILNIWFLWT